MKFPMLLRLLQFFAILFLFNPIALSAQAGFNDDRILLQGFYWESCRHGTPELFPDLGEKKWYEIVKNKAEEIRQGRFDLIRLPITIRGINVKNLVLQTVDIGEISM